MIFFTNLYLKKFWRLGHIAFEKKKKQFRKEKKRCGFDEDQIPRNFFFSLNINGITTILGAIGRYKKHIWRLKKIFFGYREEISASTDPQFWPSFLKKREFSKKSPYFCVWFQKPKKTFSKDLLRYLLPCKYRYHTIISDKKYKGKKNWFPKFPFWAIRFKNLGFDRKKNSSKKLLKILVASTWVKFCKTWVRFDSGRFQML